MSAPAVSGGDLSTRTTDVERVTPATQHGAIERPKLGRTQRRGRFAGTLAPRNQLNFDFFVADMVDAAVKGDIESMAYPMFSTSVNHVVRSYERKGVWVTVKPGADGSATMHDKDVWIYCVSQLVRALNAGEEISQVVRFTPGDFLASTMRDASDKGHDGLLEALKRLKGTVIETNIETGSKPVEKGFGLIEDWTRIAIAWGEGQRTVGYEVTLPGWLWESIRAKRVLTLSPDYFLIRKGTDRRLYELARKHCGMQPRWTISLDKLFGLTGAGGPLRNFGVHVRALAAADDLPDYHVVYADLGNKRMVTFRPKPRLLSAATLPGAP